jgi:mono/diheme cytochrome c family protein
MLKKENYDRLLIFGLAITLLMVFGIAAYSLLESERVVQAAEALHEERLEHGQEIWDEQCATCHGANGEGGVGTALNNKTLLQTTHDDRFFAITRAGVPSTEMPAWSVDYGGPLTDEDIRSVVAHIRAWEPNAPVIEPEVFAPSAEEGALIFESTCATCHGTNGMGSAFAPAVNDQTYLSAADNEFLQDMLLYGRPALGMPSFGVTLSDEQSQHVLALFDAWRAGEKVEAPFNVNALINAAVFALEDGDNESAALQIERAQKVMPAGPGKEKLTEAQTALESGDTDTALGALTVLQVEWPLGDPVNGATLYAANCAACHGAEGEGGVGNILQPNEFVQANTNAELVEFLQVGRAGTAMAGFGTRLNEQEIADIVAHLRTWQP